MCIRWKTAGRVAGFLFLLILLLCLGQPDAEAEPGAVTSIGSAEDLLRFAGTVNAGESYAGRTVTLTADINMEGTAFAPIGSPEMGTDHIFQGTFDGGGHAVTGLTAAAGPAGSAGFFSELYNATVRNLTLDIRMTANGPTAVGGLAGWMVNGTLQNVLVNGSLTAARWSAPEDGSVAVGIIAGKATGRTIMDRCAARGSVGGAGAFRWAVYVGGFIGYIQGNGSITNCYTTADAYANDAGVYAGGFFGGAVSPPTMYNAYSAAYVISGRATSGAFAGYCTGGNAYNVWYDGDLAGSLAAVGAPGGSAFGDSLQRGSTKAMQDSVFPGQLGEAFTRARPGQNRDYPVFRFENPSPAPVPTPDPTAEPTSTPVPTAEPTPTPDPTAEPTPTPDPTAEPTPTPVPTAEPTSTPDPTTEPTSTPVPTTEPTSTPVPTAEPTPTSDPTAAPFPTNEPVSPTSAPIGPTTSPTATVDPTVPPTQIPASPTPGPTDTPGPTSAPSPSKTPAPDPVPYILPGGGGGGEIPSAPRTGDGADFIPWLAVLLLCSAALALIIRRQGPF